MGKTPLSHQPYLTYKKRSTYSFKKLSFPSSQIILLGTSSRKNNTKILIQTTSYPSASGSFENLFLLPFLAFRPRPRLVLAFPSLASAAFSALACSSNRAASSSARSNSSSLVFGPSSSSYKKMQHINNSCNSFLM